MKLAAVTLFALALPLVAVAWESGYESWQTEGWFHWQGDNYQEYDLSASTAVGWTVVCGTGDALEGNCAYKGWINSPNCNGSSCRAYPGLHQGFDMPVVDVLWVRVDELVFDGRGWLSLVTHADLNWNTNTLSIVGTR